VLEVAVSRSPCHLHAFCIAPAHRRVAVLWQGPRLAGGNLWRRRHGLAAV